MHGEGITHSLRCKQVLTAMRLPVIAMNLRAFFVFFVVNSCFGKRTTRRVASREAAKVCEIDGGPLASPARGSLRSSQ
jgi:hypothetical protein